MLRAASLHFPLKTRARWLCAALFASLLLCPLSAAAQNNALKELGALLVLPVLTGSFEDPTSTYVTVTNAGAAVRAHVNVISGDVEDAWRTQDFECPLTENETALFSFINQGLGSSVSFECNGLVSEQPLATANGVMVVTLEDMATGETLNSNQLLGDAIVIDARAGAAFSVDAVSFQGVVPGGGVGDRRYRFDNVEYTTFPRTLTATSFIAPDAITTGTLVLFTLDGTTGQAQPVPAALSIKFSNDDGQTFSTGHHFDCFDIVDLQTIDGRFNQYNFGSKAGSMVMTPELVSYPNLAHDSQFDGGAGNVLGVRRTPVHGWLFQRVDAPFWGGGPSGTAAWGRTLGQNTLPLPPSEGDTVVLNAP